jgi:hypothetical protein
MRIIRTAIITKKTATMMMNIDYIILYYTNIIQQKPQKNNEYII